MDAKIKHVLLGFKNLNKEDKKEFFEIIKEFEEYPYITNSMIADSISMESLSESKINQSTVNFGPATAGCPCCGRS
ncbi:hypothetical protein L2755_20220 [Shewanella abyssi]|uniref:hypothetical protein n=1 Tax=Shewanella abyssi TaxID=311789 RepID=UPI00200FEBD2|nr:hypothetical protein [Shewanella abyssi]MCL1051929.1 hypothetical protein [Shewanella abyssi]